MERRPVLCPFKRIEGGYYMYSFRGLIILNSKVQQKTPHAVLLLYIVCATYTSLRDVERRPVLCST